MTYLISYGPPGGETRIDCETAAVALATVARLGAEATENLVVTHVETGAVALEVLQVLARYEAPDAAGG